MKTGIETWWQSMKPKVLNKASSVSNFINQELEKMASKTKKKPTETQDLSVAGVSSCCHSNGSEAC